MNFLKLAAAILLAGATANATNIDAKIIKVNKDASKVVVSTTQISDVTIGEFLSLGTNCELEVIKVPSENRILLDGSVCEETKFLTKDRTIILVGQTEETAPRSMATSTNSTRTERIEKPVNKLGYVTSGFRISAGGSKVQTEENDYAFQINTVVNQNVVSASVGYINIPVRFFGFIGDLTYTDYEGYLDDAIRLSGSVAFGLSKNLYAYLGGNLNYFAGSSGADYDNDLGNQFGIGIQFNEMIGINLARVTTVNSLDDEFLNLDLRSESTELGMTLTF